MICRPPVQSYTTFEICVRLPTLALEYSSNLTLLMLCFISSAILLPYNALAYTCDQRADGPTFRNRSRYVPSLRSRKHTARLRLVHVTPPG